jgi:transcriptional regulator with XRE-family HTH domain
VDTNRIDNPADRCNIYYIMPSRTPITDTLRHVIEASGMPHKALERETGVKRQSIMRFMRDDQTLRLDIADKLADYFGLELVTTKRAKRKGN